MMGDGAGPMSFGITKLKGREDFKTWEFSMSTYFRRQGLWDAVQGNDTDKDAAVLRRREQRALGDICLMVEIQNQQYVNSVKTAKEAWDTLERKFNTKGHWRYVYLVRSLSQSRFENFPDMEAYISHITSIGQELKTMGEAVKDKYLVAVIFGGLPSEFDSIVMTVCASEGDLDLETVISKLLDDSQRRKEGNLDSGEKSVLFSKKKSSEKKFDKDSFKCWKCHQKGHGVRE